MGFAVDTAHEKMWHDFTIFINTDRVQQSPYHQPNPRCPEFSPSCTRKLCFKDGTPGKGWSQRDGEDARWAGEKWRDAVYGVEVGI